MNYTIKNNTNKNQASLQQMVGDYFPYAQKEMGFDMPVTIVFESDLENAKNPLGKTAYYDPSNYEVVLYTDGRHPKDIMRSLSHELVHHKQNCNGELDGITGEQGYAQTEIGHRIEEEAYSLGNTCFRNWEDGVKKRTNETTYSKRRILNMNEDKLRMAIRKVIEESPAFKKHFKGKETPLESTEAVSEEEELEEAGDWWEGEDFSQVGMSDITAQISKATSAVEQNPAASSAIDQEVKKILADPAAAERVMAMAQKLGVTQDDDAETIAAKVVKSKTLQETIPPRKEVEVYNKGTQAGARRGRELGALDKAARAKEYSRSHPEGEGKLAADAGAMLGVGAAGLMGATGLAVAGTVAGLGLPAVALMGTGVLVGEIMKHVLAARAEKEVLSSFEKEEEAETPLKEWYDNSLYNKLLKETLRRKK